VLLFSSHPAFLFLGGARGGDARACVSSVLRSRVFFF